MTPPYLQAAQGTQQLAAAALSPACLVALVVMALHCQTPDAASAPAAMVPAASALGARAPAAAATVCPVAVQVPAQPAVAQVVAQALLLVV
jgi:hypothetical protein